MFGIDFSEIVVIFVIALVVLGPERLPKLAATIGRWLGRARLMARQFREQLESEANRLHDSVDLNAKRSSPSSSSTGSASPGASPQASTTTAATAAPAPTEPPESAPPAQPYPESFPEGMETNAAGAYQGAAEEFGLHNAGASKPASARNPGSLNGGTDAVPAGTTEGHTGTAHTGASAQESPVAVEAHER